MRRFYQYNYPVTGTFDLTLFPLYRIKGQVWPQLPGLAAIMPPRRTARGRDDDHLVLYFTLSGNTPLSSSEYNQIASRLVQCFYQSPGSLTSAMRATAANLNQILVDRNLQTTGRGQYIIGRLILGVLRGSQLMLAQCGPTHVFQLHGGEATHFHDAQMSGRGLGIGQTTPIHFSQVELQLGDQLLLCADLPAEWDEALQGRSPVTTEGMRLKLLGGTTEDLNAVLIQARPGKGELVISRELPGTTTRTVIGNVSWENRDAEGAAPGIPASQVESKGPASRFARILSGDETAAAAVETAPPRRAAAPVTSDASLPAEAKGVPPVIPTPTSSTTARPSAARAGRFVTTRNMGDLPEIRRPDQRHTGLYRGLAGLIRRVRKAKNWLTGGLRKFLPALLPGSSEPGTEIGGPGLAFLAVAIPLIVVTVAALVYTRYGRMTQYQANFDLAQAQAAQARAMTDPLEIRHAWEQTLFYLNQADGFQRTPESSGLRQEAQAALDGIDLIVRLDFQPAIVGGLSRTAQITRMAATNNDLYLLDISRGAVIHATVTSQGNYQVDAGFICQPGLYDNISVGNLVDILPLQSNNDYEAQLLGIDALGNLIYCGSNMDPVATSLPEPPFIFQDITAISLDASGTDLYVLDINPQSPNLWVYAGSGGKFTDLPITFFTEQVPDNMQAAIDMAFNASDLYLLFSDGHLASCLMDPFNATTKRCTDPLTFVDTRQQGQTGTILPDGIFTQMNFASAPDTSLYLLEPLTRAIFYFSPLSGRLELRGQYRAGLTQTFEGSATAMATTPNHVIFLATGSQIYFAAAAP